MLPASRGDLNDHVGALIRVVWTQTHRELNVLVYVISSSILVFSHILLVQLVVAGRRRMRQIGKERGLRVFEFLIGPWCHHATSVPPSISCCMGKKSAKAKAQVVAAAKDAAGERRAAKAAARRAEKASGNKKSRPHRKRHSRSAAEKERRLEPLIDRRAQLTDDIHLPMAFPDHFLSHEKGRELVHKKLGIIVLDELAVVGADETRTIVIRTNSPTTEQWERLGPAGIGAWYLRTPQGKPAEKPLPSRELAALQAQGMFPYLLMRFPDLIPRHVGITLLRLWKDLEGDLEFPPLEIQRSTTPAVHLGVWGLPSQDRIRITKDSKQPKDEVNVRLDEFLGVFQTEVMPKLVGVMEQYVPGYMRLQRRVSELVQRLLASEFAQRPNLDFTRLFTSIACKAGSSEILHIDWNDELSRYAIIVVVGKFKVVANGDRLVFTCFTDCYIIGQILMRRRLLYHLIHCEIPFHYW
ncbi:hypothetical protein B0H12DRAFT_1103707, partial [Mycena haematopus]